MFRLSHVPELHGLVVFAARYQELAVGANCNGGNGANMLDDFVERGDGLTSLLVKPSAARMLLVPD